MRSDYSVVLASNRGPVSYLREDGGFSTNRGAGGLAGALDPVARKLGGRAVWICAAISEADRAALRAGELDRLPNELGYRVEMLDIEPTTYSRYYDVVSNRMLWFATHCLFDELGIKEFGDDEIGAWEVAYEPVNRRFAQVAAEISADSALILFQDYHLATAPGHLRRRRAGEVIGHFTHSPFCGPQGLNHLPEPIPELLVQGMLGADLLGFQVAPWVEGFLQCCEEAGARVDRDRGLVEHGKGRTWVRAYPIPIHADELRARAAGDEARRWADRFRARSGRLIVRADRTEPSKNIVRGFQAFGRLLDRRPDLRGNVRFVACVYPSRQSMQEYRTYTESIEKTAAEVNARHPHAIELYMKDDFDRTLGALTVYDVLLVNPIMDGMNLVSKEGPAINERTGVLVLSRGAGSYTELGEHAVTIEDALDVDATAGALEHALDMSEEDREKRSAALREAASARTPDEWIHAQITDLEAIRDGGSPR